MVHPRIVFRLSLLVVGVTAPAALGLLALWGWHKEVFGARPTLLLMAYMLLLLVAVAAGMCAVVASVIMASHRAFSHGYRTAMYQLGYDVLDQSRPEGHGAKIVPLHRNGTED